MPNEDDGGDFDDGGGGEDWNNDGIPDSDQDSDGDGVPDDQDLESGMRATDGSQIISFNGETYFQGTDPFGNPVLMDVDRNIAYTGQPDGEWQRESDGVTFIPLENEIGWEAMHGTDGSYVSQVDGITGLPEYQSEGVGVAGDEVEDGGAEEYMGDLSDGTDSTNDDSSDVHAGDGVLDARSSVGRTTHTTHASPSVFRASSRSVRRGYARRSDSSCFQKLLVFLVMTVAAGGSAMTLSVMVLTILSMTLAPASALAINSLAWIILLIVSVIVGLWGKLYRNFSWTMALVLINLGYFSGLIFYIFYLFQQG